MVKCDYDYRAILKLLDIMLDRFFFFSSRSRHTSWPRDWSSDVCSSDLRCLARRATSNRHQRHAMRVRRHHRLPKLQREVIPHQNLTQLKRIILTRKTQPVELRPQSRLTHRLRSPPQNKLRPPKLRRKRNPQITKRLLRVVIQRPLSITRQTVIPPRQQVPNHVKLAARHVSNTQIGDIRISPRHRLPPLQESLFPRRIR